MKKIESKNFVEKNLLQTYQEIDGFEVIEQLLLFKGCEFVNNNTVSKKSLDDMALLVYQLKSNPTNRLYVGLVLDKFYLQNDLVKSGRIKIPKEIYDKVKAINDSYKNK